MPDYPSGTVTFLFTDVEDSTALWERDGAAMMAAIDRLVALLRDSVGAQGGVLFKTVGDATQAAFPAARAAALTAQQAVLAEPWSDPPGSLRVCMALHTGEAEPRQGDYLAAPLNRLARLLGMARGGQILLSEVVEQLVLGGLPAGGSLRELGEVQLRDLDRAERLFVFIHPDLPHELPLPVPAGAQTRHFPAAHAPFMGRETEIVEIAALLQAPHVRLVTLTGPGGIGKTRLALQVGERLASSFAGGTVFVDLAVLRDPAQVVPTIAAALGLHSASERSLVPLIQDFLTRRPTLLVLDNFEHLLQAAPVVADLLKGPAFDILVTSRAPLRLQAEHEFPVPTLRLPTVAEKGDLAALEADEAVALFVDRARAVRPDFQLSPEIAPIVAEICVRLDGLPLAIELAAARVKVLPPAALLSRLERSLSILSTGKRDAPERQRTLRDTIAWSYDLLDPQQQRLFRRLAVFTGGWTLEAAETIANSDGDVDVLGGLDSLVEKSLVRMDDTGPEPRYRMLETIREFALERLAASDDADAIRGGHAAFYLAFAEAAEPEMTRANQRQWLDRLAAKAPNLTAALGWLLDQNRVEEGLCLALAMRFYWLRRAPFDEGSGWFEAFLQRSDPNVSPQTRARALAAAGTFQHWLGRYDQVLTLHQEALSLFQAVADLIGEARVLRNLASMAIDLDELDHADNLLAQSEAVAQRSGNPRSLADALGLSGTLAFARGIYARAATALAEASERFRAVGDMASVMDTTGDAGYMAALNQDLLAGRRFLAESLALALEFGARDLISWALLGVGNLAASEGDAKRAVRLYAAAAVMRHSLHEVLRPHVQTIQDRLLDQQRERLGEEAYQAAWQEGGRSRGSEPRPRRARSSHRDGAGGLPSASTEPFSC